MTAGSDSMTIGTASERSLERLSWRWLSNWALSKCFWKKHIQYWKWGTLTTHNTMLSTKNQQYTGTVL